LHWGYIFWAVVLCLSIGSLLVRPFLNRFASSMRRSEEALQDALKDARTAIRRDDWQAAVSACDRAGSMLSHSDIVLWLERLVRGSRGLERIKAEVATARSDMYFFRAFALENLGRLDQAAAEYDRCLEFIDRGARPLRIPQVYLRQGLVLARLGRWAESEKKLQWCAANIEDPSLHRLRLDALRTLAALCWTTRRSEEALNYTREALRFARTMVEEFAEGQLLDALGDMHTALNQYDEGLRNYELSLDVFRRLGHGGALMMLQRDIAHLFQRQGDWPKALAWLQVCLREAESNEDLATQAATAYELGCLHIIRGDLGDAIGLLMRSMGLFRRVQDKEGVSRVGSTLMGLGITMQRQASADRMTYGDIVRGSVKKPDEGKS